MRIGVPKEIKDYERRVAITPAGVRCLVDAGHTLLVERGAGCGSGFADADFEGAGASLHEAAAVWEWADLIVKVKDPSLEEVAAMHTDQVLFTFLHLAAKPDVAQALCNAGCRAIAYETVHSEGGLFPVLAPMSAIAGRIAVQVGASLLHANRGGKGLLLGGLQGMQQGRVAILGGGVVGRNAAQVAAALGASVHLLDIDPERLGALEREFGATVALAESTPAAIANEVRACDLLIGGVYLRGARAPTLVPASLVAEMEAGSVVIDVAVDQGGCIETIHPTTHSNPTYLVDEVLHYGVTNMPGAVPRTSTLALTNVTLPYVERIAALGIEAAVRADPELAFGANIWDGQVVCEGLAASLGVSYRPLAELIEG